ncbi:MAG TPA: hypothetical protein VHY20_12515, partial [Pirellulales bacterium]|nr:hypothetical protein [Pirellulales bacterium]
RRGVLARFFADRAFRIQLDEQKFLTRLFDRTSAGSGNLEFVAGDIAGPAQSPTRRRQRLLTRMILDGLAESSGGGRFRLTAAGWQRAARVTRGYRLWETFLREYPDLAHGYANLDAESVDELLPRSIITELESSLKQAGRWPELPRNVAGGLR